MKVAINRCFGGFGLPESIWTPLKNKVPKCMHMDPDCREYRTLPELISLIENAGGVVEGVCSKVKIVEIPNEATDWEINEYDGCESITYVVNGKIKHA